MPPLIALLRAVNVGGTGKLPMADLRRLAEEAGLTDVRTYIQTGNLVFRSSLTPPEVQIRLEQALEDYAGKPVGVIVRTSADLRSALAENPFPAAPPNKVGILFLQGAPPPETAQAAKGQSDEVITLGAREIYIHYPSGMGGSKLRLAALKDGTMRNLNTARKLVEMAG